MKYLVLALLSLGLNAHADMIGYGDKDCKTVSEKRALLFNKEICSLEVSCYHFPLNNPDGGVAVTKNAYCRPDSANSCLAPQACLEDKSVAAADIPMIIPKFGGDDVAPIKSTGDAAKTCACEADKSKRTDGSKRSDPAKTGTAPNSAVDKRAEGAPGRGGVN